MLAQSRFPAAVFRRVAIVAVDDSTFGTARMYAAHRESSGLRLHVFRSFEDADAWLSESAG